MGKRITCTVTNDLTFDQRMIRICTSLAKAGYEVTLIGRNRKSSQPLSQMPFNQKRIHCFFDKGKWFYIEYNIRLFIYILFLRTDVYCAIDLDTILPNLWASKIRGKKRVYDAHELFCEMDEIVARPTIYKIWKKIESYAVPQFLHGYTIGHYYAQEFNLMYHVKYEIVRNATLYQEKKDTIRNPKDHYILYQGAVNEGRCFETLIPAMKYVNCKLIICGHGNFFEQAKKLIRENQLEDKIKLEGYVKPDVLKSYTADALIGITLFSTVGKSNFLSMANRFFDYMHAGVPQLCMDYPEYQKVNKEYELAVLIKKPSLENIADALNDLLQNESYRNTLSQNALIASKVYCWQEEEKKLINFYSKLFEQ